MSVRQLRSLRVTPRTVRVVALSSVVAYGLLVLSGGAVRLTGSGLGCPDWPSCYQHGFVAAASFHPMIEDMNRFFTGAVSVLSVVALLAAFFRLPRRRDIVWPAAGLVAGLVAQIVLGGIVVLTKLNPYLVALHFILTLVVLVDAIVFFHRAGLGEDSAWVRPRPLVGADLRRLTQVVMGTLLVVSAAGTIVSGSGPHAGAPGTRRIPIAFRDIAELHSSFAWLLLGLSFASLFAFHHAKAPERVQRRLRTFFELVIVQGALGYTQYFLHDAAAVVEIHLAGVTLLWIAVVFLYLSLDEYPAVAPAAEAVMPPAPVGAASRSVPIAGVPAGASSTVEPVGTG